MTIQFLLVGEPFHLMFAALSMVTAATLFVMARANYQAFAEGIANRIVCRQNEWDCRGSYLKEALAHSG